MEREGEGHSMHMTEHKNDLPGNERALLEPGPGLQMLPLPALHQTAWHRSFCCVPLDAAEALTVRHLLAVPTAYSRWVLDYVGDRVGCLRPDEPSTTDYKASN
jgi:hypothetical protein